LRLAAVLTALVALAFAGWSVGTKTANAKRTTSITDTWITQTTPTTPTVRKKPTCKRAAIIKGIRFYRGRFVVWHEMMDDTAPRSSKISPKAGCAFLKWLAVKSQVKAKKARAKFVAWFKSAYAKWECIHSHEGAWNDPNAPYYGGLQMDYQFQSTYGPELLRYYGTADKWPIWAQLLVAERAYHSGRGFHPWPNTARYCGLL